MTISDNKVVSINYTLTDDSGEVLDSSEGREPLAYLHGFNNIITGLEEALIGKEVGAKLNVIVEPGDGYGERVDELVRDVPMDAFQGVDKVEEGMQFQAQTEAGMQVITVTAVNGDTVTIDGNHPLAGVRLTFDVEIMEIREATEEELQHGHVHGAGGHHH